MSYLRQIEELKKQIVEMDSKIAFREEENEKYSAKIEQRLLKNEEQLQQEHRKTTSVYIKTSLVEEYNKTSDKKVSVHISFC